MSKFFDETMQGLLEAAAIEYKLKGKENSKSIEDMLFIGVSFSPNDIDIMSVMRRDGDKTYVVNMLKNEEAREIYNKLIGVKMRDYL